MNMINRIPLLAALLLMPLTSMSQQSDAPQSLAETSDAEITNYRDWTLQCIPGSEGQAETCAMVQQLYVQSGKRLLAMQVSESGTTAAPGEPALVVVMSLPLGVYLPSGVALTIDDRSPLKLEYERCDRGGCYAGVVLGESLLAALKEGVDSVIRFNNLAGRTINASLSLKGFTAAYNALLAKLN